MTGADDMDGMDRLSIKADRSGIVVYVISAAICIAGSSII